MKGSLGIFEVSDKKLTFEDYLPKIAAFFLKDKNQVFLMNDRNEIILKHFTIWDTLTPFINCKLKGDLPRLRLVLIGGMKESEIAALNQQVKC